MMTHLAQEGKPWRSLVEQPLGWVSMVDHTHGKQHHDRAQASRDEDTHALLTDAWMMDYLSKNLKRGIEATSIEG